MKSDEDLIINFIPPYVNKLRDEEFVQTAQSHDILCIQETHCGPQDVPTKHFDEEFKSTPHCRKMSSNNRYFGGMILMIRKSIRKGVKFTNTEDPDILGITLKKDFFNLSEDVNIWFVYASPVNSPYTIKRDNIFFKLEQKIIVVKTCGDLVPPTYFSINYFIF